jgi:integrase/recombinase XerD
MPQQQSSCRPQLTIDDSRSCIRATGSALILAAAGIRDDGKTPLFRSAIGKTGVLTDKPMNRVDAYRMIRRRTAEAGFKVKLGCHVFRATGITAYLEAGGTLENAQAMAAHESPRTTKLYDRTSDEITLDEIERITI